MTLLLVVGKIKIWIQKSSFRAGGCKKSPVEEWAAGRTLRHKCGTEKHQTPERPETHVTSLSCMMKTFEKASSISKI